MRVNNLQYKAERKGEMVKLTVAQEAAMKKLTTEWQSPFDLQTGCNTLDALVRRGLVERKAGLGSLFSPATSIKYRLTKQKP